MKKKMVMSKAAKAETTQKGEMDKDEKALSKKIFLTLLSMYILLLYFLLNYL